MSDTSTRSSVRPWGLAIGLGIALWLLASAVTGRREPWDSSMYWQLVYPLSLLGAMALAWAYPARAWRCHNGLRNCTA